MILRLHWNFWKSLKNILAIYKIQYWEYIAIYGSNGVFGSIAGNFFFIWYSCLCKSPFFGWSCLFEGDPENIYKQNLIFNLSIFEFNNLMLWILITIFTQISKICTSNFQRLLHTYVSLQKMRFYKIKWNNTHFILMTKEIRKVRLHTTLSF